MQCTCRAVQRTDWLSGRAAAWAHLPEQQPCSGKQPVRAPDATSAAANLPSDQVGTGPETLIESITCWASFQSTDAAHICRTVQVPNTSGKAFQRPAAGTSRAWCLHLDWEASPLSSRRPEATVTLQITASVFGVGAPEALLVGVVALVVFGPRGLAEVCKPVCVASVRGPVDMQCVSTSMCRRVSCMTDLIKGTDKGPLAQAVKSLGATLKTFQPTIREVLGVTQELRSTLEEQIGLDDIRREFRSSSQPTWSSPESQTRPMRSQDWDSPAGTSSDAGQPSLVRSAESMSNGASSSEGSSHGSDGPSTSASAGEELEALRRQSAAAAWGGQAPQQQQPQDLQQAPQHSQQGSRPPAEASRLAGLTLEDLEAELRRRKGDKQNA